MALAAIYARAANGVIGKDNALPWHLPEDMAHFKRTTLGCPVVMGRKTWETLEAPLPGRDNVVVTRRPSYEAPGARVVSGLEEALAPYRGTDATVFILGGGEVFEQALPMADVLHLTLVDEAPEGDAFFPELPEDQFYEASVQERPGPPKHVFVTLQRVP